MTASMNVLQGKDTEFRKLVFQPKGFFTNDGYVGFLPDGRRLSFPTYAEYLEYVADMDAA